MTPFVITTPAQASRIIRQDVGTINIRDVPKDFLHLVKMAATVERRTIKGFLLSLAEERIEELEKKGLLPKGK